MNRQTARVLELLRIAGRDGLRTGDFMDYYIASYSQRCGDLRRMGYEIKRERVGDSGSSWRYTLVSEPEPAWVGKVAKSLADESDRQAYAEVYADFRREPK